MLGGKKHFQVTFMFIPCILNNKCLLCINICTNKWCKFILKLLRHVSVLIHHLESLQVMLAKVMNY